MDLVSIFRAAFALLVVVGLILAFAYGLRRYAPQLLAKLQAERGEKRLSLVETLVLDPTRRLVLVRLDNEERLILLGEGREMLEPQSPPPPKPLMDKATQEATVSKTAQRTPLQRAQDLMTPPKA